VSPGVNFKRDTSSGTVTAGECDGSQAIPILSALADSQGVRALETALVNALGQGILNTTIPSNYTAAGFDL